MPNNSSARQKKQSKKKKTTPPPLHKEDKASLDSVPHPLSFSGQEKCTMDTSSSSLSLAGAEKETSPMMGHTIMMDYYNSLSDEERTKIHVEAFKTNPRASPQELIEVKRAALWKAIHGAQKMKSRNEKDTSSPPLLSSGSASMAGISMADSRNKDGSLSMLSLGTFKLPSSLSMQAQPKSDKDEGGLNVPKDNMEREPSLCFRDEGG
jgi:hypothetical protein